MEKKQLFKNYKRDEKYLHVYRQLPMTEVVSFRLVIYMNFLRGQAPR